MGFKSCNQRETIKAIQNQKRVRYKENEQNYVKNTLRFQNFRILDFKKPGLSTMVRLLHCDPDIIGSKHRQLLSMPG